MSGSADIYTEATILAILAAGRFPVWSTPDAAAYALAPSLASSGVFLDGALRTLVRVKLREEAHRRTVRLTIPVWDEGAVYSVTINGATTGHDSTGDADLEATIEGIVDVINTDLTTSALVLATAVESEEGGGIDTVLIQGKTEADYSIDFTEDASATLAALADRCRGTAWVWLAMDARPGSVAPEGWAASDEIEVDRRGYAQRFDTAGIVRLHLQLTDLQGDPGDGTVVTYRDPDVSIGPCLAEEE